MAYDPLNPDAIDLVRLLSGDSGTPQHFTDPQIAVLLTEAYRRGASAEGAPYCAAATVGEAILAKWSTRDNGIIAKTVSKLSITYASGSASSAYREYLGTLRNTCTALSLSAPAALKAW